MPIKDILAVVSTAENDAHVLAMAEQLAKDHGAHLTALVINWSPSEPPFAEGWVLDGNWAEMLEELRTKLEERGGEVERRLSKSVDHSAVQTVLAVPALTRATVGSAARHFDLVVAARPDGQGELTHRDEIVEAALFGGGRPVIVVPPDWKPQSIGENIAVGWNASRESARALADAGPFIERAKQVTVITVDAKPAPYGYGDLPGGGIALHLSRHGKTADVRQIASAGRSDAKALTDEATALAADMLVIGGYGRPRWQETIFGGTTRNLLSKSDLPVLLSH